MASHTDIRRLVMNDERLSTLILTFDHTLNISNLQYALSTNVIVREIVVYTDDTFLPRFNANEIRGLFEVLGGIPSLQRLCFNARSGYEGVISVQALTYVLSRATQLSSFAVSDVKLQGTEEEWVQFAEQLENCQHLKSFCVIECELSVPPAPRRDVEGAAAVAAAVRPPFGPDDTLSEGGSKSPLDPVVMVLSFLPSMDKVYLHSTRSGGLGKISGQGVGALLLSKSLKVLKIRDFELGTDTIVSMARKLRPNRTLRDLKIGTMTGFDSTAASAFATMLENNTHLECLEMCLSTMITDDCAKILSGALKANRGLKSFAITAEDSSVNGVMMKGKVSDQCNECFVDMLRSNYVIENFVLFQRFPVKPEFKLFVTLNKLGRGKLLQSEEAEPEQWIQALATVNDDLDALHYYISINPDLCTLALERMNRSLLARPNKRRKLSPEVVGSSPNHVGSLFEPSACMPASSPVGQALVQYPSHVVSVPGHRCASLDDIGSRYANGNLHPELVCSMPETVGSSNGGFHPEAVELAPDAIVSRNASNSNPGSFRLAPDAVHSASGAAFSLQNSAISTHWAPNDLSASRISAVPDATLTLNRHNVSSAFGASESFRPDTSYSAPIAFGSFRPDGAYSAPNALGNSATNALGSFRPDAINSATNAFGSFRPEAVNSAPNAFGSFRPDTANSTPNALGNSSTNALGSFRPDTVRSATNSFGSSRPEAVNSAPSAFGSPPTGVDEDDDIF